MHYIRLVTEEKLDDEMIVEWFNTVLRFSPSGLVIADYEETDDVESEEISVEEEDNDGGEGYAYDVNLTRDLSESEAQFIVSAWEMRVDGDFEIETSNLYSADANLQHPLELDMDDEVYESAKQKAAKFIHNRWVEEQTDKGWRYGTRFNDAEKVHPALRNWDSLTEEYRRYPTMTKEEVLDFITKYKHLFS